MVDHGDPEAARELHRAPHHARVHHRPPVVGNRHRARLQHRPDGRQLLARAALRDRADRKHVHHRMPPRLFDDVTGDRRVVVHRRRIGHRADGSEPAGRGRARSDSIVSACSNPGSRRCTCISMKPGATISPDASKTSAPLQDLPRSRESCRPRSTRPRRRRKPEAGSITRPFLITSDATHHPFEHRHSHRDTVLHLIQDHRSLRIRHL